MSIRYYLSHNDKDKWEYQQAKTFDEEYDNYMLYSAKMDFQMEVGELKKSSNLQYILFKDVYGDENEKS